MNRFFYFVLLFLLAVFQYDPAYAQFFARNEQALSIIIYGDGLLAGTQLSPEQRFDKKLEQKLKADGFDTKVTNMSREGLLAAEALDNLDMVIGKNPDVVVLQVGETDVARKLSIERYGENIKEIVSRLRNKGIYVVLVGVMPPADASPDSKKQLNQIFYGWRSLSEIVPVYPYAMQGIAGNSELTMADGYHPNPRGVDVIVNGLYKPVEEGLRWKQSVLAKPAQ